MTPILKESTLFNNQPDRAILEKIGPDGEIHRGLFHVLMRRMFDGKPALQKSLPTTTKNSAAIENSGVFIIRASGGI
ncbi:MAG: hypothetical protein H0T73_01780 [Ardenticatenales bacterium]|nr:hypothetical protein [Ardenticatenales bacterium]